jgi:hypothetical protein
MEKIEINEITIWEMVEVIRRLLSRTNGFCSEAMSRTHWSVFFVPFNDLEIVVF